MKRPRSKQSGPSGGVPDGCVNAKKPNPSSGIRLLVRGDFGLAAALTEQPTRCAPFCELGVGDLTIFAQAIREVRPGEMAERIVYDTALLSLRLTKRRQCFAFEKGFGVFLGHTLSMGPM